MSRMIATVQRPAAVPTAAQRRARARPVYLGWPLYFAAWTAVFLSLSLWLLSRNYVNDGALWGWSTVIASLDAPQGGFNRFVLLYPQVQYYFITLLSLIPGLKSPQVPYLISAAAAAEIR